MLPRKLPPGASLLLVLGVALLAPLGFLWVARDILQQNGVTISNAVFVTTYVLSLPLLSALRVVFRQLKDAREASKRGARVVTRAKGRWPGNFDLLVTALKNWEQYTGDVMTEQKVAISPGPTFNMNVLWDTVIFTSEPEYIKEVLATNFQNYEKGRRFKAQMASVLGTGVFNADGDLWKFHRSMTRPFFSRDRISDFEIYEHHAQAAIARMKDRFREGYALDFQDLVAKFTLDSATEFLFGKCVNSLESGLPYPHNAPIAQGTAAQMSHGQRFAVAFAQAQETISMRAVVGKLWRFLELTKDKTEEPMKIVNNFIEPILKEAIQKHKADAPLLAAGDKQDIGENETLLDHLVQQTNDPVVLKDEILSMMIAGRDTTANTLMCSVYLLATNPDVLSKLRDEIMTHVGSARPPTYDDIRAMKYLRAFINETLRLFPAVPFNIRQSIGPSTWKSLNPEVDPRPLYIPPRTDIIYSVLLMHRRKDLWGPDAETFDPDRFIDERLHKYLAPNPFIFLPFNAGPRICLGQQFAYNEVSFMIIRLLQHFSGIDLDPCAQPPDSRPPEHWKQAEGRKAYERFWPKSHLTMHAKGGLWLKMTEAPEAADATANTLA